MGEERVSNSVCEQAFEMDSLEPTIILLNSDTNMDYTRNNASVVVATASMEQASMQTENSFDCGSATHTGSSVWFSIEGTDGVMSVSTCQGNSFTASRTTISIFEGIDCRSMKCVDGSNVDSGSCTATSSANVTSTSGSLEFFSKQDQRYFLLV